MSIEERLTRLERENRHLKVAGLLVVLIAASVLLMGQARPSQRITANSFAVTNASGDVIALLSGDERGLPYLVMYSPGQVLPAVTLSVSYVEQTNPQEPNVRRTAFKPNLSLLQLAFPGSNTGMGVGLELDSFSRTPRIYMMDDSGTWIWQAP